MKQPTRAELERWRPELERLLANPVRRCSNGGRVLAKRRHGGYSLRPQLVWLDTGVYPSTPFKSVCDEENCADCWRLPQPSPVEKVEPPAQPQAVQVPPPPPVPSPVSASAAVGAVERGGAGGLERSSRALVPAPVPAARSSRRPPPRWVVPVVLRGLLVVVVFVVCVVAVQAVSAGVSELREVLVVRTGDVPSSPPSSDEGGPVLPG